MPCARRRRRPLLRPTDRLVGIQAWLQIFRMPNKILTEIGRAVNVRGQKQHVLFGGLVPLCRDLSAATCAGSVWRPNWCQGRAPMLPTVLQSWE